MFRPEFDPYKAHTPDPGPKPVELGEIWLPVPGFEGRFEISSYGRILNIRLNKIKKNWCNQELAFVHLYKDRRTHGFILKRMVARLFIGPPPIPTAIVRHHDGDPFNCRADNLYYAFLSDVVREIRARPKYAKEATFDPALFNQALGIRMPL